MRGFKLGFKPKSQHLANGGMVKGAGTGTSDDIKTKVPAGSYIMPADSTKQIGAPSLGALGFNPQAKVPVNLSNGEYEMPPEQVHAVGVQALDQMKGATHTPVESRGAKGFKPEMFFVNGGEVDPEKLKQPLSDVTRVGNSYSSNGSVGGNVTVNGQQADGGGSWGADKYKPSFASNVLQSVYPETNRVLNETAKTAQGDAANGNYGQAIGAGLGGIVKTAGGVGYDLLAHPIGRIAGQIGEVGKGIFGIEDSPQAAASTAPVTAKSPAVTTQPKIVPNPMAAGASGALGLTPQDTASQASTTATPSASGIIRNGNSFSDGKSASVGADGITPLNPQWNSKQNIAAKNNLLSGTPTLLSQGASQSPVGGQADPTMNALLDGPTGTKPIAASSNYGMRTSSGFNPAATAAPTASPQSGFNVDAYRASQANAAQLLNARRQESNIQRDNELRMIAPRSGANGQYTIAQQNARMHLIDGKSANDLPQYTTDVNNAAGLQKQAMGDQAATDRTAMQEQGANYRNDTNNSTDLTKFGATNDLANREFNSGADARGFASQQARIQSKILAKWDAAKSPEEKSAAMIELQQSQGKSPEKGSFSIGMSEEPIDPANPLAGTRKVPIVVNNNTGDAREAMAGASTAKAGVHQPSSAAEYNALPKGAQYMKDGQLRVKN